jgi:multidrug efflux system outer membrane protein
MMSRRAVLLMFLVATGCAGTATRPVKVAPVVPPAGWRTDAGVTATFDRDWWQAFGDPGLTAAVERALAGNDDIQIAVGRVREAHANLRLARADFFPTIEVGGGAQRIREVSPFGTPEVQNEAEPFGQVAWELDLFGRIADQAAAARDAWFASQAARDATRLSVAAEAANGYVALLSLDAQLDVARRTLTAREESLHLARSRVAHGYSPKLDLQQAEADYQATAQIVPQIQQAIAQEEDALSILTGDPPQAIARNTRLDALASPAIPAGLPSELLRRRPDIAAAEYRLAASDKALSAARKRFLPQLSLTGSGGVAFSTLLANPISLWAIGGSILAPLFEGGRLTAGAEAAAARRDQAAFAYRKAVLTSFGEVEDGLAAAKRLDERIAAAVAQRDALADALRLATNRYREGYSPYLEQLDAQRGLLSAELTLVQLRAGALQVRIGLYGAMGGGWSAEEVSRARADAGP